MGTSNGTIGGSNTQTTEGVACGKMKSPEHLVYCKKVPETPPTVAEVPTRAPDAERLLAPPHGEPYRFRGASYR